MPSRPLSPSKIGGPLKLTNFYGKVVLVSNLASQCGFTENSYAQLNELHKRYEARGLNVMRANCTEAQRAHKLSNWRCAIHQMSRGHQYLREYLCDRRGLGAGRKYVCNLEIKDLIFSFCSQKKPKKTKKKIIGVPSNTFKQETGTDAEIYDFAVRQKGSKFTLLSKTEVNGPDAHPMYKWLKVCPPPPIRPAGPLLHRPAGRFCCVLHGDAGLCVCACVAGVGAGGGDGERNESPA